jgi:branched-subunit amino acid aminotransferase/4-amino-4-deoxychorismate lyase
VLRDGSRDGPVEQGTRLLYQPPGLGGGYVKLHDQSLLGSPFYWIQPLPTLGLAVVVYPPSFTKKDEDKPVRERMVETRVTASMENLAVTMMQANNLAADSPQYEALARTASYALDLAEVGLSSETNTFNSLEPTKAC